MNDNEFEQLLEKELDALPATIMPQKDLWPGVEHSLPYQDKTPQLRVRAYMLTASIMLFGILSLFTYQFFSNDSYPTLANYNENLYDEIVSLLQLEHEQNKQVLLVEYEDRVALDENWQDQLSQLEEAENVIYQALMNDPDNIALLKILRQVQAQQLQLIDSVFSFSFNSI